MTDLAKFQYAACKSYHYHVLTKHSLESLYASSSPLDWALQPDPFRSYSGTRKVTLPQQMYKHELDISQLIHMLLPELELENSDNRLPPLVVPADLRLISSLLYYSMAISAWKQLKGTNHKWALRVNPSSGNLHPTEAHLLVRGINGLEDGAYHYFVKDHSLELRSTDAVLMKVWNLLGRPEAEAPPLMLVLSSVFWREAWKYKDRAFRYCQLDLGHALAAICLAAAGFGWNSRVIAEFPDLDLAVQLGLASSDETPMLLIPLYPDLDSDRPTHFEKHNEYIVNTANFQGIPNRLSSQEIHYQSIKDVYEAGCLTKNDYFARSREREEFLPQRVNFGKNGGRIALSALPSSPVNEIQALSLMRRRRSAVDMDGRFRISLAHLARILIDSSRGFRACYLRPLPLSPSLIDGHYFVYIIVYIHRVDGIAPGVYYFDRGLQELQLLYEGNVRNQAKFVSCLQDIASDGVFAVSLIADMHSAFQCYGERAYRFVHQEAGFIGQLFYLTALALDIDATGIGCFLDDEINQSLPPGMEAIYNFTFGKAMHDSRLTDLAAYDFTTAP